VQYWASGVEAVVVALTRGARIPLHRIMIGWAVNYGGVVVGFAGVM
jgi:hypothetical protein